MYSSTLPGGDEGVRIGCEPGIFRKDYGMRVQHSVLECELTPAQYVVLKNDLMATFDPETESLRFYRLGKRGRQKAEHVAPSLLLIRQMML